LADAAEGISQRVDMTWQGLDSTSIGMSMTLVIADLDLQRAPTEMQKDSRLGEQLPDRSAERSLLNERQGRQGSQQQWVFDATTLAVCGNRIQLLFRTSRNQYPRISFVGNLIFLCRHASAARFCEFTSTVTGDELILSSCPTGMP